jgi:DNA sulfur modification protein DndD
MILDRINFNNFGPYRGNQPIELTPPSKDKPIILVGALNGMGKTTLMDGLQLALYGKNAHCSNRGELAYDEFLRRSVHRGVDQADGAGVEVEFRHTIEGIEHKYRINRSWVNTGKGIREQVGVFRDGAHDSYISENWAEQVETFLPSGVSNLFFFDGEKIEQLADIKNASRVLSTAIHSLLGIELVDQLTSDLNVLERRKRFTVHSDETKKQIEIIRQDINALQELCSTITAQEVGEKRDTEAAEARLRKSKEQFRLAGGDLFIQREQILAEKAAVETRVTEAERELRELAAGFSPLLLVQDLLADVTDQAEQEKGVQESLVLGKFLKKRDSQLVQLLKHESVSEKTIKVVNSFFTKDDEKRSIASKTHCYLSFDDETRTELDHLQNTVLPEANNRSQHLVKHINDLNEQLLKLEKQLTSIPDPEALEGLKVEMAQAEEGARQAKARLQNLEARLEQLKNEKERKQKNLEALLFNNVDENVQYVNDIRIVHYSEKVRETLQAFRSAVVRRHITRIEHLMMESFRQLARKRTLISEMRINPENFGVDLFDHQNRILPMERLSAGERQLLATSMLWGLARASGRPLPTIIDTPLGRLDSEHRANLVERYFPYASHQVILLSTDEEIDKPFYEKLKARIGHSYILRHDEATASTSIERGYFWN